MRCLEQALPSLQPRSPERLTGGKHQSQAGRIRSAGQTQPDKGLSSRNLLRPSPEYLIFATHIVSMVVAVGHISHTQRNPANSSTTASFLSYCYQSGNLLVAGLSCACPVNPVSLIQSRQSRLVNCPVSCPRIGLRSTVSGLLLSDLVSSFSVVAFLFLLMGPPDGPLLDFHWARAVRWVTSLECPPLLGK